MKMYFVFGQAGQKIAPQITQLHCRYKNTYFDSPAFYRMCLCNVHKNEVCNITEISDDLLEFRQFADINVSGAATKIKNKRSTKLHDV